MTNAALALPEMFLAVCGFLLLMFGVFRGEKSAGSVRALTVFAFILAGGLLFWTGRSGLAFGGAFIADDWGRFVKTLVLFASALCLMMGKEEKQEYPVLVLFATLGMMLMVSAHNLISLYVGLELQNMALYVLTSFRQKERSPSSVLMALAPRIEGEAERKVSEAGMKYFTLGALSSGLLLFGLSLIYGFTQTVDYTELLSVVAVGTIGPGLAAGLAFALAGLAFKISAVPFHMWAPDVYEGAPTPIAAFLAVVPKVAALAMIARFLVEPMGGAVEVWRPLLMFFAVASMLLGAFAGLVQDNVKRLMAYSGMINMGTMLLGLVVFEKGPLGTAGIEGLLLYLALYVFGVMAVFGVLLSLKKKGETIETLSDLSGLSKTHPGMALAMGAALFSLSGIPPFAGFFGKYMIFLSAVKSNQMALAVLGIVLSVVAAGYYLRIVKVMYFDAAPHDDLEAAPEKMTRFVVALAALAVTLFVLIPAPLMEAAQKTAGSFIQP